MGPPGTGKTLLARAVAGEANVPFFSISGSDFVEMFVGVGASRVRDLFEQGKKNAPCIVFIDEIDAVGRHRGAGLGGGHDEREQTLNQLLVEMDGFESNEGVILVAATNRPDVLDPALLRPGRFDRRIVVNRPDVKGREGILAVHTRKIPLSDDVDVAVLARGTSGFSGADLANLVNEAALNAARYNQKVVRMADFEFAKDKVLMGAERRSMIISENEKRITAIHEAGHALLAVMLPHADPIHKVTIIPRGMALGLTTMLPIDEKHNYSRDYLRDQICILLGGRIAEEITLGSITTGAGNDLERATDLARKMVCEWGMSDSMGPLTFGKKEEQIFLGREIAQHQDYSEDTALKIDHEVKRFVTDAYARAQTILMEHKPRLIEMAEALLSRETLDAEQVRRIVAGEALDDPLPAAPATPQVAPAPKAKERPARSSAAAAASGDTGISSRRNKFEVRPNKVRSFDTVGLGLQTRPSFASFFSSCNRADDSPFRSPGGRNLVLGDRTVIMGVVNVTPDSFSDGGEHFDPAAAIEAGVRMAEQGAGIIDVGGESTRPGAQPVDEAEERRRVIPVIEALAGRVSVPISVDTYKAATADAGARGGRVDRQRHQRPALRGGAGRRRGTARRRDRPDAHARPLARHVSAGVLRRRRRRSARRAAREHGVRDRRRRRDGSHPRRSGTRLREGGASQLRGARAPRRVQRAWTADRRRAVAEIVPVARAGRYRRRHSSGAGGAGGTAPRLGDGRRRDRRRAGRRAHRPGPRGRGNAPGGARRR